MNIVGNDISKEESLLISNSMVSGPSRRYCRTFTFIMSVRCFTMTNGWVGSCENRQMIMTLHIYRFNKSTKLWTAEFRLIINLYIIYMHTHKYIYIYKYMHSVCDGYIINATHPFSSLFYNTFWNTCHHQWKHSVHIVGLEHSNRMWMHFLYFDKCWTNYFSIHDSL